MIYTVEHISAGVVLEKFSGKRRDHAANAVERLVFSMIEGNAQRDTKRGWQVYHLGQKVAREIAAGQWRKHLDDHLTVQGTEIKIPMRDNTADDCVRVSLDASDEEQAQRRYRFAQ